MGDRKKNDDIVKKVFDREGPSKERLSALFTHFKFPGRVLTTRGQEPEVPQDLSHGIEFGSSSIKWVQLTRSLPGNDIQLVDLDEQPYEVLSGGNRFEQERQALKKLMIRHTRRGRFVLSLSSRDTAYVNLAFPKMEPPELREAIVWKLKQIKPLNLEPEQLSFNYMKWDAALDASGRETGYKVLVYCVPQQLVGEKLAILKECGIVPHAVEPAPLSLVNLKWRDQEAAGTRSEEVLIWLDLGEDESSMMVTKGGVPSYVRSIPLTGNQLTRQIAQYCQTDESRAEDLKCEYGMLFDDSPSIAIVPPEGGSEKREAAGAYKEMARKIRQGLASILENLVIDIEHSYKHFSYQISQSSLPAFSRICLVGGASALKGLDLYLAERLGVPVDPINPFSGMKAADDLVTAKAKQIQEPLAYGAACSLAMDSMTTLTNPRNLMMRAPRRTPSDLFLSAKKKPKISVAVALLAIALAIAPQIARVKMAERRATAAQEKLQSAKKEMGKFQFDKLKAAEVEKELTDKKANMEAQLKYLQDSMQHQKKLSEALNVLASILPAEIWIKTLTYKGHELNILGVSPDTASVMKFIGELKKKTVHFANPVFDYAQRDKNPEYDFQLKVSVV